VQIPERRSGTVKGVSCTAKSVGAFSTMGSAMGSTELLDISAVTSAAVSVAYTQ